MSHRPPGFLRPGEDADVRLMIGFAGHVDHGKTRLVRLLTGCETDRLKAEKERGLSIELGFAPCSLGSGLSAGIVDVPGHEQFIKNMVAGAAGMDMAILVVAADDGVMPQTVEHLQIMQFLGVEHGIVALSKIDLVRPEHVEEVQAGIEMLMEGSFLEGAPICPVSAETLEGFERFYEALVSTARSAKVQRQEGVFRMPVERVFSPPGYGTVATGIPLAGSVAEGDEVEIQPGGLRSRVRAMQRFLRDASRGGVGQCLALNLAGLPRDAVRRGCILARPGYVQASRILQVRLQSCNDLAQPLRSGEELRLHTGTVDVQAELRLYRPNLLNCDQSGFGALHLQEAVAVSPTDRFVLRRNSPAITVAGGVILQTLNRKPRGSRAALADRLAAAWQAFASVESRFEHHFVAAGASGSTLPQAAVATLIEPGRAEELARALAEPGRLLACPGGSCYLHSAALEEVRQRILSFLKDFHTRHPSSFGPTTKEMSASLRIPEGPLLAVLEKMAHSSIIEQKDNRMGLAGRKRTRDDSQAKLEEAIEAIYRQGEFTTPRPDELPEMLGKSPAEVMPLLDYLCQKGILVRLGKNVVFHRMWLQEAERRVVTEIQKTGRLDSADFKAHIGSSRKYALAILDYFDTIHITLRSGNLRRLHPAYLRKHPELAGPSPP